MNNTEAILRVPIFSRNDLEEVYNVPPSNVEIAKFYGWKQHTIKSNRRCDLSLWKMKNINGLVRENQFDYHKNWGSLMPVVEKIERLGATVFIGKDYCSIEPDDCSRKFEYSYNCKLGAVWLCVLSFIYWYNAVTNPKPE